MTGGTFSLVDKFLPAKCGIAVSFVPMADHAAVRAAITAWTKVYTRAQRRLLQVQRWTARKGALLMMCPRAGDLHRVTEQSDPRRL